MIAFLARAVIALPLVGAFLLAYATFATRDLPPALTIAGALGVWLTCAVALLAFMR